MLNRSRSACRSDSRATLLVPIGLKFDGLKPRADVPLKHLTLDADSQFPIGALVAKPSSVGREQHASQDLLRAQKKLVVERQNRRQELCRPKGARTPPPFPGVREDEIFRPANPWMEQVKARGFLLRLRTARPFAFFDLVIFFLRLLCAELVEVMPSENFH